MDKDVHSLIQTLASGRTAYGVAQFLAAECDYTAAEFRATKQRWQNWLQGKDLSNLERFFEEARLLGFEFDLRETKD